MFRLSRNGVITSCALLIGVFIMTPFVSVPPAHAASIDFLRVSCDRTRVRGATTIAAPYVRVQVTLASNLTQVLAEQVIAVRSQVGARYRANLTYPAQPAGTHLIVSVGEWDGGHYLQPANLTGVDCSSASSGTPTVTPTPTLVPTSVWTPTPVPTLVGMPTPVPVINVEQEWINDATLIEDSCGGASTGAQFPVTLVFDPNGKFFSLRWFDQVFVMYPIGARYIGSSTVGDATSTLKLAFQQPSPYVHYDADLTVTFASTPDCHWKFAWTGMILGQG